MLFPTFEKHVIGDSPVAPGRSSVILWRTMSAPTAASACAASTMRSGTEAFLKFITRRMAERGDSDAFAALRILGCLTMDRTHMKNCRLWLGRRTMTKSMSPHSVFDAGVAKSYEMNSQKFRLILFEVSREFLKFQSAQRQT